MGEGERESERGKEDGCLCERQKLEPLKSSTAGVERSPKI